MKKIRIFISSPCDVQIEREIARNVINELNSIYKEHIKLEVVMWEDFPLSANATFQEGINHFITNEPIDIAVFILWSRLGTPLSVKFQKEDGSKYQSGTEYEFDMMMKLHNDHNHPGRILTYVKQNDDYPKNLNWQELREAIRQKERLDTFLKEYFRDEETNSNYAYLRFGKNISFEQMFRTHITNAIKEIIGEINELKVWDGNPYVGLNSFEYNQQTIFFGRRQLIYDTASKLSIFDNNINCKSSLIILGESGSGKSSFVKAGLLPFFCNRNSSNCDYAIIQPSMYNGQMYKGVLELLVEKIGCLRNHPFVEDLQKGISSDTDFKYLRYELEKQQNTNLIVYIDQFEELFSDNRITEEERKNVLLLLRGLIETRKIIIIISMRSDFYNRFSLYEELSQIKEKCEVIDLPVMGAMEIAEIIEEPAKKAGLKWEIDEKGVGLNRYIIKEATAIKDLPLIEFALSEMYEARNPNDVLTKEAYEQIGGIKGSILKYANNCYMQLTEKEKEVFNDLLGFVIAESSSHKETYVRKTSLREDLEKSETHKIVIEKMLKARLFISGKDNHGKPTITITHEILLKSWDVVAQWIEKEKAFIVSNNHYEQIARHWHSNGMKKQDLIRGRSSLLEAEYYHFKNNKRVSNNVLKFLNQSFKKECKRGILLRGCFIVLATIMFILNKESFQEADEFPNLVLYYTACLLIFISSFILRIIGAPTYKTLKFKIITCIISLLLVFALLFIDDNYSIFSYAIFTFPLILVYLLNEVWEYLRRLRWKKKFVPYMTSDEIWVSMTPILYCIITFFFLVISIGEDDEVLERRTKVADELFEILNNASNYLTYEDNEGINYMRKEYLEINFEKELHDDKPDNRDFEYARVLYNINRHQEATKHIDKSHGYKQHLFAILCNYAYGNYEETRSLLKEYAIKKRYDEIDNYKSTSNLIWIAEKLNEFEIAEMLDSVVCDTLSHYRDNISRLINKGHIHLYKGEIDQSLMAYDNAFSFGKIYGHIDQDGNNMIPDYIKSDFHIFSRFKVFPDSTLQKISDIMKIEFQPAYISTLQDSVNAKYFELLDGVWWCNDYDTIVTLNINKKHHLFTYDCFDRKRNYYMTSIKEARFGRSDNTPKNESNVYIDEFNLQTDENSLSKILIIDNNQFIVESIKSSNNDITRKKFTFKRNVQRNVY